MANSDLCAEWLLVNNLAPSLRDRGRSNLLREALCDSGGFTPGRNDGQLLGGDPQ